mgnify:CR=1 FL=1
MAFSKQHYVSYLADICFLCAVDFELNPKYRGKELFVT